MPEVRERRLPGAQGAAVGMMGEDLERLAPEHVADLPRLIVRPRRPAWSVIRIALVGLAIAGVWAFAALHGRTGLRLCPGLTARPGEGVPTVDQLVTDRSHADEVLRAQAANLRDLFPYVVSASIGPGWRKGLLLTSPTEGHVVPVHDYAIIATTRSPADCPPALPYSTIGGMPVFFAYR